MATETKKKMKKRIAAIIALLIMLGITTYALILSFVEIEDNKFITGMVDIELNDGKPVFDGSDNNIEPNYTIVKEFTVENKGMADVYYRLYLDNITGGLKDVLNFKIYEKDALLYSGSGANLTKESPCASEDVLKAGEKRVLRAEVNMNMDSGNAYQESAMMFDITADAVQVKNNPDRKFE